MPITTPESENNGHIDLDTGKGPLAFPLPPVLFVVLLALGIIIARSVPDYALAFSAPRLAIAAGIGLGIIALAVDAWAMVTMRTRRTNVLPTKPALALVSTGPFRYSRNPIYLGNVLLLIAAGLISSYGIFIVLAVLNAIILDRVQIRAEETHLKARFGHEWDEYRSSVRRWI